MKALCILVSVCLVAFAAVPATAAVIIDDFTVGETVADSREGQLEINQTSLDTDHVWSGNRRFRYDSAKQYGKMTIADGEFRFESGGAPEGMLFWYDKELSVGPFLDATNLSTSFVSLELLATSDADERVLFNVRDQFGAHAVIFVDPPETVPRILLAPISKFSVLNQRDFDFTSISAFELGYTAREFTFGQIAFVPEPSNDALAIIAFAFCISSVRRRK
ncbi:hypothetical protein ACFL2H_06945 [Planctomycetota bacterium]